MNEKEILKKHKYILDYLLEYKKEHPDFVFLTRMKNNNNRLEKGYCFQGGEDYIFVPLFEQGCKDNKTKTIGFVVKEEGQYIEIVFKNIANVSDEEIKFHNELVNYLKNMEHLHLEQKSDKQFLFWFRNNDLENNLRFYINDFRNKANELLQKYNIEDKYIISEDKFQKNLQRIEKFRQADTQNPNRTEILGMTRVLSKIKNIILYGVPGVGKTHTITKLVRLIEEGKSDSEIFSEIRNKVISDEDFSDDLKEGMAFVTFHQSFGYEDFIEGFRPNEEGNIELVDGVFKRLASQARENLMQSQTTNVVPFREALHRLLKDKIENEEIVKIDLKRADSYYLIYDYNDRTIFFEKQNGDKSHSLSIRTLERMYREERNDIIQGGLAPYYNPLLDKLLQIKHSGGQTTVERKNYYLVIDEINRGNISKIFGELITLIEEDKRDRLEVTLPYSKEPFSVPSNLYIIGTMNSTDKSIALIDVALRRRFTFLKMEPKPELIEYQKAKKVFAKLNDFLKERLGEDHLIGHSYFMKVQDEDDLSFVLDYKIKPLLEEYFYGDSEGFEKAFGILQGIE